MSAPSESRLLGQIATSGRSITYRLDFTLTVLAFLVLPAIAIETVADDPNWLQFASLLDWAIWIGFGAVLIALYFVIPDRNLFFRKHAFDVLIVVLTPPVAPEMWQAFRALRVLRSCALPSPECACTGTSVGLRA